MPALILLGLLLWGVSVLALGVLWMGWELLEDESLTSLERTLLADAPTLDVELSGAGRALEDAPFDPIWIWAPGPLDDAPASRRLAAELIAAERVDFGRSREMRAAVLAQANEDEIKASSEDPWDRLLWVELARRNDLGSPPAEQAALLRVVLESDDLGVFNPFDVPQARRQAMAIYRDVPEHPAAEIALMYGLHLALGAGVVPNDWELTMALVREARSPMIAHAAVDLAATRYRELCDWGAVGLERLDTLYRTHHGDEGALAAGSEPAGERYPGSGIWLAERAAAASLAGGSTELYRAYWRDALAREMAAGCQREGDAVCAAAPLLADLDALAEALEGEGWEAGLEAAVRQCAPPFGSWGEAAAVWNGERWIWLGWEWLGVTLQPCLEREAAEAAGAAPPPADQQIWISVHAAPSP